LRQRCERNIKRGIQPRSFAADWVHHLHANWLGRFDDYAKGMQVCEQALQQHRQRGDTAEVAAVLDLIGEGQAHLLVNLDAAEKKGRSLPTRGRPPCWRRRVSCTVGPATTPQKPDRSTGSAM
jgi:hypothetical protein